MSHTKKHVISEIEGKRYKVTVYAARKTDPKCQHTIELVCLRNGRTTQETIKSRFGEGRVMALRRAAQVFAAWEHPTWANEDRTQETTEDSDVAGLHVLAGNGPGGNCRP